MKLIFCIQKVAIHKCKSPGGSCDACPELLRPGKTELDSGICHALSVSEDNRDSAGAGTTFEET